MVKEELYINGENVELLDSLNPNLTFNIADIANLTKEKQTFLRLLLYQQVKRLIKSLSISLTLI